MVDYLRLRVSINSRKLINNAAKMRTLDTWIESETNM